MKSILRVLTMVLVLGAGVAFAADPPPPTMSQVKSMAMKERSDMMAKVKSIDTGLSAAMKSTAGMQGDQAKALDAQLADVQKQVKALSAQLAAAPKYFDNPEANPNKP
jgi:hypothetical protein